MRDYLKKVLVLVKPYRLRFGLGLLCGFLSGLLAPTLPLSLTIAVTAVFHDETPPAYVNTNAVATGQNPSTSLLAGAPSSGTNALTAATESRKDKSKSQSMPGLLGKGLSAVQHWLQPEGRTSTTLKLIAIGFIPASMFLRGLLSYLNIYLL